MGSATTYSRLEAFGERFGKQLENEFQFLVGRKIVGITDLSFDYFKSAYVILDDKTCLDVHFGWATEEEIYTNEEPFDDGAMGTIEHFKKHVIGQKITKIESGYERDDMYYIYAITKNGHSLEIPFADFNVHDFELYDDSYISKDEFEAFEKEYFNE